MRKSLLTGLLLLPMVVLALIGLLRPDRTPPPDAGPLPVTTLFAASERFPDPPARWDYRFPADHGVHPEQFGEYWLFAGRLIDATARVTGFQLVFYRLALTPEAPDIESNWATRQVYRAQLVLDASDTTMAEERYSREVLGLSGADQRSVWLENWAMRFDPGCHCFILEAATDDTGFVLKIDPTHPEPVTITGVPGLPLGEPGSHGYWWPHWRVHGTLNDIEVTGEAVLEHVWGRRLPVAQGQLTLDRLWLTLENGTALRCLQLRRRGGGGTPLGNCLALSAEGEQRQLDRHALNPSSRSSEGYPLEWVLHASETGPTRVFQPQRQQPPRPFMLPVWSGLLRSGADERGASPASWGWLELSGY